MTMVTSGCVEAIPGLPLTAPADDAADYAVRTSSSRPQPALLPVGGALDLTEDRGATLTVIGWAPASAGELLVLSAADLVLVSQRRFKRPDAARAIGTTDDNLGFRLVFRPTGRVEGVCILFRPPGAPGQIKLAGSQGAECPA